MEKTPQDVKKTGAHAPAFLYSFRELIDCDDLFFVVAAAIFTYTMRNHELAAFAALHQSRSVHLPVGSSLISMTLGRFIFGTN